MTKHKIPTDGNHDAFPCVQQGLTKREYFAAMAMQGMLACDEIEGDATTVARYSLQMADALIEELNK
jgi:hypothetical protein